MAQTRYDQFPTLPAAGDRLCWRGWPAICAAINDVSRQRLNGRDRVVIAIECYTGLHLQELTAELRRGLKAAHFLLSADVFKTPVEIEQIVAPYLGGADPIFGFYAPLELIDFLDPLKRAAFRERIRSLHGVVVVFGTAALLCCEPDVIVYADMPRWEGQLRQRRHEVSNLGAINRDLPALAQIQAVVFRRLAHLRQA